MALVVWQGIRNGKAQSGFQRAVSEAATAAHQAGQRIDQLTQDQRAEVIRREQAERDLQISVQASAKATREGVTSDIKKSPIKVELSGNQGETPLRITPQFVGVLANHNIDNHTNQGTFMVLTNKIITPVRLLVTCDNEIEIASGAVMGTGSMMGGGWGGRVTRSNRQFGVGILSPAWAPTNPLLVTVYANANPGRCSFEEQ